MKRSLTVTMTALTGVTIAAVLATGIAYADRAVPKAGAPCGGSADSSGAMDGSQTFTAQGEILLCAKGNRYLYGNTLTTLRDPHKPGSHMGRRQR